MEIGDSTQHEELTGLILMEPEDIDGEYEILSPVEPELVSEPDSESEDSNLGSEYCPKFPLRYRAPRGGAGTSWEHRKPPTELQALDALDEIKALLRPQYDGPSDKQRKQRRYKESTVKGWTGSVLRAVQCFLNLFAGEKSTTKGEWTKSSEQASQCLGKTSAYAPKKLREQAKKFISSKKPPTNPYGTWTQSRIDADEEFAQDISLYLQSEGKYVKAEHICAYLNKTEVQEKWGLKKSIGKSTANRWMKKLGYRWVKNHKGQYVDGHEREDVVAYRKKTYLPKWYEHEPRMRTWDKAGVEEPMTLPLGVSPVVPWFHDESIYYAHDRRQSQWVHEDVSPTPYAKGEGASMMMALYFSPDHGYLRSPDGKEDSRIIFKPGKNRDGYFDNEDMLAQATTAMDICEKYYPNEKHVFIFDNATTHLKRAEDALSARKMPKKTPKPGTNWGIEVTKRGADGKVEHGLNGKPLKIKIKMGNGSFSNGQPQEFYFPEGHPRAGVFKGMAVILQERGYTWANDLRAECRNFKCTPGAMQCCCRRILYSEPDFMGVKSLLEMHCAKRGFEVFFLPKFHFELNPLEMVWGRSKFHYRLKPPSSKEEDLEANMIDALEAVTHDEMRRYIIELS